MKVLLVGGGGREHALAWKLHRDHPDLELLAAPGNPGIAALARCIRIAATDVAPLVELARRERIDLTIVGPEAALAAGIADAFRAAQLVIFGPSAPATEIESSKTFAKELMMRAGVPTARAVAHTTAVSAKRTARELGAPVVIKASGLAAGKGVIVCATLAEADRAIDAMLQEHVFGEAGAEILVEEFMEGEELSLFAITDGTRALTFIPAQDHKRLLAGDVGPNTGGMGAYAPVSLGGAELVARTRREIFEPTLAALRDAGRPFAGLLFAGLMVTQQGPRVVEFNARFGDPETQALLPLMESDLLEPLHAVARGDGLAGCAPLDFTAAAAVTTVVAAAGYPDAPRRGDVITLPTDAGASLIFHAGTTRRPDGELVTSAGRVFSVTAVAPTLAAAQAESAHTAASIQFAGRHFRADIGWRELQSSARAPRD